MSLHVEGEDIDLRSYLAIPAEGIQDAGVVLTHGFPQAPREAASAGLRYAELADRIADQTGITVLTFNFRGTAQSEGDFSLAGWCRDIDAAVANMRTEHGIKDVWLAGFGTGGSLALNATAADPDIRGVASFSARAHFDDWAENWEELLAHSRAFGMIRNDDFPSDVEAWVDEMRKIRPIDVIGEIAPRPLMLVHGADDERIPVADARELAAAAGRSADLRIIPGASHRLRHDPRIVALLLGWLDRVKGAKHAAPAPAAEDE